MLDELLMLSAAVVAAVEFVRSALQSTAFASLEEQTQSLILQAIAFLAGILAAISAGVNVLTAVPAFENAPEAVGVILTGLIVSTGSAGIHAFVALLGIRGNVTAETATAQGAQRRRTYAPFM